MTGSRQARPAEEGARPAEEARAAEDPSVEVRAEDAFDVEAMTTWLRAHAEGVPDGTPQVRQFPGGASNLTYLLGWPDRELILRRPPAGVKAKGAHDMQREFTIQSRLASSFGYVAQMLALCDDQDVIGSDFYVMQRLEGTILRRDLPEGLRFSPDEARTLCTNFLDVLVELHRVDPSAAGLDDLGRGWGYVARQVGGWSKRYRAARTDNVPDYERVMGWLDEQQPEDVAICVIHNDFRLDNVVLAPDDVLRVDGVLDWEMATLGDPLMDLAGAAAYWIQDDDEEDFRRLRRQPSHLPGMLTRQEMVDYYTSAMGWAVSPEQWRFYEVFGLFRLGVIAQQIYYRYHHGQTTNEAYARFLPMVQLLDARCNRLIDEAAG